MKHHYQEFTTLLRYSFPGDVDYIAGQEQTRHHPYVAPEIFLLRARIELEDGYEIEAPQWLISLCNLDDTFIRNLMQQYEDWRSQEAEERSMDRAMT